MYESVDLLPNTHVTHNISMVRHLNTPHDVR